MNTADARELRWTVNGLNLAGLSWGDPGARPLLALHGWLDNAASFSLLAPLLTEHHVVAVDLTGHGRSDHRSADSGYQIWDDLPELTGIVAQLGWESFTLLGHSRGAIISCLLAAAFGEAVDKLVLLDGLVPPPLEEEQFVAQLRRHIDEKRRWQARENRSFDSLDAAIHSRAGEKLPAEAARLLAQRNLATTADGRFAWTTDLRLRGASAVKLTAGQIRAVLMALDMPTLLVLAQQGFGRHPELVEQAQQVIGRLQVAHIDGSHHCHMGPQVNALAALVNEFLKN
jgi:pimeloyl-ACP methyl ester carboxylesterase